MSFQFIENPQGQAFNGTDLLSSALEQPMSLGATFWDQAKGGVLESFGLGTALRDAATPELAPAEKLPFRNPKISEAQDRLFADKISEEQYKTSPSYREAIPYEPGMTQTRADALADQYDRRVVRDFYSQKRPITAFLGTLAGSAADPINYIPIAGEYVAAANIARFGKVAGRALTSSVDAMANTALAGVATAPERAKFGDDVSWQSTVSQIAMAGLIGGAFGAVHGRFGKTVDPTLRAEAETKLATLDNVQKARVALNDALDGMVRDGGVSVSRATASFAEEAAQKVTPEFRTEVRAYEGGQMDLSLKMRLANTEAGRIDFAEYDGQVQIQMISVPERLQRQGIASQMLRALQEKYPDKEINWGSLTDQGAELKKSIPFRTVKTEDAPALNELAANRETAARLEKDIQSEWSMGKGLDGQTPELQQKVARLTDLEDSISKAEERLSGKSPTKEIMNIPGRDVSRAAIDDSVPKTQPNEGVQKAAGRVGKPEASREMAEQYRVDPETGNFPEMDDIEQLKVEGRLTADDLASLDTADETVKSAKSFGEAVKAFANCVV